jgi:hypothetical protein
MNITIAATATAQGRGAIAVIRVSGSKSSEAYLALTKKTELPEPNNIKPGWVYDGNEKIRGGFYDFELTKVGDTEFRVEKIIKRRKRGDITEHFVKWKGFNDTYNSWIKADDVTKQF